MKRGVIYLCMFLACLFIINGAFAEDISQSPVEIDNNDSLEISSFDEVDDVENSQNECDEVLTSDVVETQEDSDTKPAVSASNDVANNHVTISDGKNYKYDDKNFEGCSNKFGGAILLLNGSAEIKNCVFKNNHATNGGAIWINSGCSAVIEKCTFINNEASSGNGGAIYIDNATSSVIIRDCTFTSNKACNGNGGAVVVYGDNVKITNCVFNKNTETKLTSKGYGGAIFWAGQNGCLSNSKFTSNVAKSHGGALQVNLKALNLVVDGCTFAENKVKENDGGAISWGATGGIIKNSKFTKNVAIEEGGAIEAYSSTKQIITVSLNNCQFQSNSAKTAGGAIYTGNTKFNINNCRFTKNSAGTTGGAVYSENSIIKKSTFTSNSAKWGGAIYSKSKTSLSDSKLTGNKASVCGGAIYEFKGSIKLSKNTLTSNSAKKFGGAVCVNDGTFPSSKDVFTKNSANMGGAVYSGTKSKFKSSSSTYKNNKASNSGGAIYEFKGNTILSKNKMTSNSAKKFGGAVCINEGILSSSKDVFTKNSAKMGGAVYSGAKSKFKSSSSTFIGNKATDTGGAINSKLSLTLKENTFTSNKARTGGAICISKGSVTSKGDVYYKNKAASSAGAIIVKHGCRLTVTSSYFIKNTAKIRSAVNALGKVSANNNWWGNTVSNKKVSPQKNKLTNAKVKKWLVLKVYSTKSKLKAGKKARLIVDLKHNNHNKKVSDQPKTLKITFIKLNAKIKSVKLYKGYASTSITKSNAKKAKIAVKVLGIKSDYVKIA